MLRNAVGRRDERPAHVRRLCGRARRSRPVACLTELLTRVRPAQGRPQGAFLLRAVDGVAVEAHTLGGKAEFLPPVGGPGIVHGADNPLLVPMAPGAKCRGRLVKRRRLFGTCVGIVTGEAPDFPVGVALRHRTGEQGIGEALQ